MHALARIDGIRETEAGTGMIVTIPDRQLKGMVMERQIRWAEMRLDDGKTISTEQRKKIYATIRDISDWSGYLPEEQKEWLKYGHMARTGCGYFSLSDCTMDTAREFINTILEYALENGVPLAETAVNRTDDIGRYLYYCIKHGKCCVCGRPGELHHVDAIGMGNDRKRVDDSGYRKMCLCRTHHTIAHQRGRKAFEEMYKVHGIVVRQDA